MQDRQALDRALRHELDKALPRLRPGPDPLRGLDDPVLDPEASWPQTDLTVWRERLDAEIRRRQLPVRLVRPIPVGR